MSMHKIPLTPTEEEGLRAHGLDIGTPSQLSDESRHCEPELNTDLDGYQTEDRCCCDCKSFKDMGMMQMPICQKKLMGVTRSMRVTFKTADGTCFE